MRLNKLSKILNFWKIGKIDTDMNEGKKMPALDRL